MKLQVEAMCEFHAHGIPSVDYGNNISRMALSGNPADIRKIDAKMKELFPDN